MRTFFLTLLLFVPCFLLAQYTSNSPFIAYDNCEADPSWQWGGDRTTKWSYWTGANHILPGSSNTASMSRSSNYSRKGSYSYQARITKDWSYNSSNNTHRSELAFSTPGQEPLGWRWASVSIYLPSDFCLDQAPMTIAFNTKAQPDNYATPFRLDVRKGRYIAIRADVRSDGNVPTELETDLGAVERGIWVDWVYHRNFEMNSSGYLELYKNGKLVYSHYGPNFVQGSGRSPEGYLHTGLYKWPWLDPNGMGWGAPSCDNPIEVYYDEYKFGGDNASLQDFLIDQSSAPAPKPVAPTVANSLPDIELPYNTTSKSVSLNGVFNDDAGAENLSLTVSGNSNSTIVKTASISGNMLNLSLVAGKSGTAVIKIKATDKDGLSIENSFTVTVTPPAPQAPKIVNPIPNQQLSFNTATKSISLVNVFSDDKPVSDLAYTASSSNNQLVGSVAIVNSVLNITLLSGASGSSVIKVKATDKDGLSVENSFTVTITAPAPQAPKVANPIPNQQLSFNTSAKSISLVNVFTDDKSVSDLTYTATSSNNLVVGGIAIVNNNVNLTFVNAASGTSVVKVKATDKDGLSVENSFTITISAPVVQAPKVANPIADQSLSFNTVSKSISLGNVFTDDQPVSNLTYVATSSNAVIVSGLAVVNNVLTLTLKSGNTGNAVITIKATDEDGLSVQDQFTITLLAKPPAISQSVNTGGSGYTFEGKLWSADRNFSGGKIFSNTVVVSGTDNKQIYKSERYGNFKYSLPVPNGDYIVRLHFAEIFHKSVNQRKFNVAVENNQGVLTGYDIVAKAGGSNIAKVEEFKLITVADGILNIDFTSVIDNAKVSAIEIISTEPLNTAPRLIKATADQQLNVNTKSLSIAFGNTFTDTEDAGQLIHSVEANSNPSLITSAAFTGTDLLLTFNGNEAGIASIKVRATDPKGLFTEETFNVTIGNQAPVADAGNDISLELPVSSTVLNGTGTDEDGTVMSYSWTQVGGPVVNFNSNTIPSPSLTGLTTAGTYIFQLIVTDNVGIPAKADQVTVVVNGQQGLHISELMLVNAATNNDIGQIKNGDVIDLSVTGSSLNVKALINPPFAGRVNFALSGSASNNRDETAAPYALFGDVNGTYSIWTPAPGSYTLTVTPFAEVSGGESGSSLTIQFTVVANGSNTRTATTTIGDIIEPLSSSEHSGLKTNVVPVITAIEAFPNPFTSQVNISFRVKQAGKAKMEIFNSAGKTVAMWPEENVIPEVPYRKVFSAGNNVSGMYFYRITTSKGEVKTGKIMLAK